MQSGDNFENDSAEGMHWEKQAYLAQSNDQRIAVLAFGND